jgi:hypothetical protein
MVYIESYIRNTLSLVKKPLKQLNTHLEVDLVLSKPVIAVYQNLVHGDRFFKKNNNQTAIDHAKIT